MAEITSITSEALQAKVRELLPSQRGFGEDLQASNVISLTLDLTDVAQGTNVPQYQQQALAFGSQTAFITSNATNVLANSPGFYRITGTATCEQSAADIVARIQMTDSLSTKNVWQLYVDGSGSADSVVSENVDLVFFVAAGISLQTTTNANSAVISGSIRQVADVNGNPVNPSGFTPQ